MHPKPLELILSRKPTYQKSSLKKNNSIFQDRFLKQMLLWIKMVNDPAFHIKFITTMLRDFKKITVEFLFSKGYDINSIALDWANPYKIAFPFLLYWIFKNKGIDQVTVFAYNRKNFYINDMHQVKLILNYWLVYRESSKFLENQENNRILLVIFKSSLTRLLRTFMALIKAAFRKKVST
jgi:hypothetical protein